MVRSELVRNLCNVHPSILRRDMEKVVEIIITEMIEALNRNEAVEIRGWGKFKTVIRKARLGRNPATGVQVNIPMKNKVHFKASSVLLKRLNEN